MVYIPPRIPDPAEHNRRIAALAERYRGLCITCGRATCPCGDGHIGIYSGPSTTHYGYRLQEAGGRLSYQPVPGELEDVRRVFKWYGRLGSAGRVIEHLERHGHRCFGREWVLRILRCPIHRDAGSVDRVSYQMAMSRLNRSKR